MDLWFNGKTCPKVGVGFAQLVKGGSTIVARSGRRQSLEEEPDARWIRPLLLMSDELLKRMYRSNASFIEQVHEDARRTVPRVNPPTAGGSSGSACRCRGNGDGACRSGQNGDSAGKTKGNGETRVASRQRTAKKAKSRANG